MRIVLTGAKGQLGKALYQMMTRDYSEWEIIGLDKEQLDITEYQKVTEALTYHKPDIMINCAAYTAVDACEDYSDYAYLVNAEGPHNLAKACKQLDVTLVHISTDYVFDGMSKEPIKEDARTGAQSIYGKSKCLGEAHIRQVCDKYFIVRTAWLYGDGNNFVRTMLNLADIKDEINVVSDQIGSPTYAKDLARVIIDLIQTDYYGTYHVSNQGACSWYEFALKIFEYANKQIKVNPIASEDYISKVVRPKYSVLDCSKLEKNGIKPLRQWSDALREYIDECYIEDKQGRDTNETF